MLAMSVITMSRCYVLDIIRRAAINTRRLLQTLIRTLALRHDTLLHYIAGDCRMRGMMKALVIGDTLRRRHWRLPLTD